MTSYATRFLEHATVYRLWQAVAFASDKFAPVLAHNDLGCVRRVLDVGCGPGTNAKYFGKCDYVGIDINPRYVDYARRRYGRTFVVANATQFHPAGEKFDFVLLNSFLHHVNAEDVKRILSHLSSVLTSDGSIHILDLVLPERPSLARMIARWDRGQFPRLLSEWRDIFSHTYDLVVFEPFMLGIRGIPLWNMVYCKGRLK
jgi:SAM-dependent methyltransferase